MLSICNDYDTYALKRGMYFDAFLNSYDDENHF